MSAVTATLLSWFLALSGVSPDAVCGPQGLVDAASCPAPPPPADTPEESGVGTSPTLHTTGSRPNKPSDRIYNGI